MPSNSDVNDRIIELNEAMQKLQILKQIGAENLVIEQEKEIYHIQQDILHLNKDTTVEAVDLLPKKCRFCMSLENEEDRLECSEKNSKTCKNREPVTMGLITAAFLKVLLIYGMLLLLLLTFSLLTDILFKFLDDKVLVFIIAFAIVGCVVVLFRGLVKSLYRMIS
jgi:hypothetical protein